jgi:hypothetical protein
MKVSIQSINNIIDIFEIKIAKSDFGLYMHKDDEEGRVLIELCEVVDDEGYAIMVTPNYVGAELDDSGGRIVRRYPYLDSLFEFLKEKDEKNK